MTSVENTSKSLQQLQQQEPPRSSVELLVELLTIHAEAMTAQTQSLTAQTKALEQQTKALEALAQSIDYLIGQNQSMLGAILSAHAEPDQTPQDTHL